MNKINIEKVCRTCVLEQEQMLDICSSVNCNGKLLTILKILNSFVSTEFIENSDFPNQVCGSCLELAVTAYKFKVQCDRSQLLLEEYIKNLSVKTESDINEHVNSNFNNNLKAVHVTIKEENAIDVTLTNSAKESRRELSPSGTNSQKGKRKYTKRNKLKTVSNTVKEEKELLSENQNDESQMADAILKNEIELNKDLGSIYFCSQCNKSFKNKYIFNAHEKRHEFKGQFLCNVCGKGFSSQSCLNRHNRVHTGEKKYECPECHKRFPSSNNLNLHSRTHSGHKPYLCTVCGKRFSHPTGLTYHMRTHTHEKPYGCDLCGKRFAIQCHFDHHKKTHSGERPFACQQCGRAFIKKIDLQRHEEIHTGLKPHVCTICKKSFLRIKNLNYHMMLHTEERPHICSECGKGFIRSYYLRDHMRKHHRQIYL